MSIADEQRRYYLDLLRRHGRDPKALGHRDRQTQHERFERIARLFPDPGRSFRVHEIGCGFGDFGEFLQERFPRAVYSGSDICDEFVEICRERFPRGRFLVRDVTERVPEDHYDFVTQSGTLNGRLGVEPDAWQEFVFTMLRAMYAMASSGIASNFLTTYGDPQLRRAELHYQDEKRLLDFVTRELSRHLELDMGGPLYEYTLRVYRPEHIRSRYPDPAFRRYF